MLCYAVLCYVVLHARWLCQLTCDSWCRDDVGRTALHWAAELGLPDMCQEVLSAASKATAALAAEHQQGSSSDEPPPVLPAIQELQVSGGLGVGGLLRRFSRDAEVLRSCQWALSCW